jgi:hypothetical protein
VFLVAGAAIMYILRYICSNYVINYEEYYEILPTPGFDLRTPQTIDNDATTTPWRTTKKREKKTSTVKINLL